MPPLAEISANERQTPQLTRDEKIKAATLLAEGWAIRKVGRKLQRSASTIHKLKQKIDTTGSVARKPYPTGWGGFSEQDERRLIRLVLNSPQKTYQILQKELNTPYSIRTMKRTLKRHGLIKYIVRLKRRLKKEYAEKRLKFVNDYIDWSV